MRFKLLAFSALWAVSVAPVLMATDAADDFNRPDSSNMGPDWVEVLGDFSIVNNQGSANGQGYMVQTTVSYEYKNSTASVDIFPIANAFSYSGIIAAYNPTGDFLFIKLQDNDADGLFDRVYFYQNWYGGAWVSGQYFFDLAVPTPSARVTLSFDSTGDIATLEVDRNFDGQNDEKFSVGGILMAGLNLGTGIGINSNSVFDNFVLKDDGVCSSPAQPFGTGCAGSLGLKPELSLTGCPAPGAPITLAITQGLASSTALLVLGLGQSSLPLGAGCSLLASPLIGAPIVGLPLSTSGSLFIPAVIPVGASGAAFTLQAFVVDPANSIGVSATDGLSVSIP